MDELFRQSRTRLPFETWDSEPIDEEEEDEAITPFSRERVQVAPPVETQVEEPVVQEVLEQQVIEEPKAIETTEAGVNEAGMTEQVPQPRGMSYKEFVGRQQLEAQLPEKPDELKFYESYIGKTANMLDMADLLPNVDNTQKMSWLGKLATYEATGNEEVLKPGAVDENEYAQKGKSLVEAFANQAKANRDLEQITESDVDQGTIQQIPKMFVKSFGQSVNKSLAGLAGLGGDVTGGSDGMRNIESWFSDNADTWDQIVKTDDDFNNSLVGQYTAGLGQLASTLAFAAVPGGIATKIGSGIKASQWVGQGMATVLGVGAEYNDAYESAIASGMSEEEARKAAQMYSPAGILDVAADLTVARFLKLPGFNKKAFDKLAITLPGSVALEGGTEGLQRIYQNEILNKPWYEGAWEEALVGGLVGGTVNVASKAAQKVSGSGQEDVVADAVIKAKEGLLNVGSEKAAQALDKIIDPTITDITPTTEEEGKILEQKVVVPKPTMEVGTYEETIVPDRVDGISNEITAKLGKAVSKGATLTIGDNQVNIQNDGTITKTDGSTISAIDLRTNGIKINPAPLSQEVQADFDNRLSQAKTDEEIAEVLYESQNAALIDGRWQPLANKAKLENFDRIAKGLSKEITPVGYFDSRKSANKFIEKVGPNVTARNVSKASRALETSIDENIKSGGQAVYYVTEEDGTQSKYDVKEVDGEFINVDGIGKVKSSDIVRGKAGYIKSMAGPNVQTKGQPTKLTPAVQEAIKIVREVRDGTFGNTEESKARLNKAASDNGINITPEMTDNDIVSELNRVATNQLLQGGEVQDVGILGIEEEVSEIQPIAQDEARRIELGNAKEQFKATDVGATAIADNKPFEAKESETLPEGWVKETFNNTEFALPPTLIAERRATQRQLNKLTSLERAALAPELLEQKLISEETATRYRVAATDQKYDQARIESEKVNAKNKLDTLIREEEKATKRIERGIIPSEVDLKADEEARAGKPIAEEGKELPASDLIGMSAREALQYFVGLNLGTAEREARGLPLTEIQRMQRIASIWAKSPLKVLDADFIRRAVKGKSRAARYGDGTIRLPITRNGQPVYLDPTTLIHEIGHSLTADAINKWTVKVPRARSIKTGTNYLNVLLEAENNQDTPAPVKKIIRLYRQTVKELGLQEALFGKGGLATNSDPQKRTIKLGLGKLRNKFTGKPLTSGELYALGNLNEFVAQAWSDENFQNLLKQIKVGNEPSIFQQFIQAIKDLLGFESDTVAAEVVNATYALAQLETEAFTGATIEERILGQEETEISEEGAVFAPIGEKVDTENVDANQASAIPTSADEVKATAKRLLGLDPGNAYTKKLDGSKYPAPIRFLFQLLGRGKRTKVVQNANELRSARLVEITGLGQTYINNFNDAIQKAYKVDYNNLNPEIKKVIDDASIQESDPITEDQYRRAESIAKSPENMSRIFLGLLSKKLTKQQLQEALDSGNPNLWARTNIDPDLLSDLRKTTFKELNKLKNAELEKIAKENIANAIRRRQENLNKLPEGIRNAIQKMVTSVEQLTLKQIKDGIIPPNSKLILEGREGKRKTGITIAKSYMIENWQTYADKFKQTPEAIDKLVSWAQNQYIKGAIKRYQQRVFEDTGDLPSDKVAREVVAAEINANKENIQNLLKSFMDGAVTSPQTAFQDILVKRLGLDQATAESSFAEAVKSALQEVNSATTTYAQITANISEAIANYEMFTYIRENAGPDGENWLIDAKEAGELGADALRNYVPVSELETRIPGFKNAFSGLWIPKEFLNEMENTYKVFGAQIGGFVQGVLILNNFSMAAQTSLNPIRGPIRNFFGNPFLFMASGKYQFTELASSFNATKNAFLQRGEGYALEVLEDMYKYGMVEDNPNIGLAREQMKIARDNVTQKNVVARALNIGGVKKTGDLAARWYTAPDNLWRYTMWTLNQKTLKEAYSQRLPERLGGFEAGTAEYNNAIKKEAANWTKNEMPSFSRMNALGRAWRKPGVAAVVAPFIGFTSEILRISHANLLLAYENIKNGTKENNAALRNDGYRRLAGTAFAYGSTYAIASFFKSMFDIDDEEEEAARETLPPWDKNANLIWWRDSKTGKLNYFNTSFLNPLSIVSDPFNVYGSSLRENPEAGIKAYFKATGDAALKLFGGYIDPQIATKAIVEAGTNSVDGRQVYNPEASLYEKIADGTSHIWDSVQPGILKQGWALGKALGGVENKEGVIAEKGPALLNFFLGRSSEVKAEVAFKYKSFEMNQRLRDAARILTSEVKRKGGISDYEIEDSYKRANEAYGNVISEAIRLYQGQLKLGTDPKELDALMDGANLSKDVQRQIKNGIIKPYGLSKATSRVINPERVKILEALQDAEPVRVANENNPLKLPVGYPINKPAEEGEDFI